MLVLLLFTKTFDTNRSVTFPPTSVFLKVCFVSLLSYFSHLFFDLMCISRVAYEFYTTKQLQMSILD